MLSVVRATFKETIRSKWLIMFSLVFFFLALNLPFATLTLLRLLPTDYLPTFIASIISISFPLIPLLPLPLAATSIVEERENGVLQYVLSTPISRSQFLVSRLFGLFLATTAIIVLGFGVASLIAFRYSAGALSIWFVTLASCILNFTMLGIASCISIASKKRATALGAAIFLWFIFTVITDANLLAPILASTGRPDLILPFVLLNPVESSRLLAIFYVTTNPGDLARAGPTAIAMGYFFGKEAIVVLFATLGTWIAASLAFMFLSFQRQDIG
jgi:Cu-processing system permease protein